VTDLLKRFNLPDSDIVDAYYLKNPRSDGRTAWGAVLSYYRGAPTHEGYFNFSGKEHDASDILTVMFHLRDVLLRIVFQIVGYDGSYQPPVIRWRLMQNRIGYALKLLPPNLDIRRESHLQSYTVITDASHKATCCFAYPSDHHLILGAVSFGEQFNAAENDSLRYI
jgi:hypothetical protein